MDLVELLKEGVEEILAGDGTLDTVSKMQERVCQIAQGSAPWHLSEKQLNAELYDILKKVWNFSLGLEKKKKNPEVERGEYFGMLRYFCVGVLLFLVVERGINDTANDGDDVNDDQDGDDSTSDCKMSLTFFQFMRMTVHTGKVCLEYVPDLEKAQFCFQIVIEHYSKIRDASQPEEIQTVLRDIIRILYSNGKIFQSEAENQEILKGLLLAASDLAKDCPDEGACFAALCLRNGIRLAGQNHYRKAAVWLTAATKNDQFVDEESQALALRRLAQVYYDWGAINDFPDAISGLEKANSLVYHPTGGFLKLKIVLASRSAKDPLDEEIETLISELLQRVDVGAVEAIVLDLKSLGFHSAARSALDRVLSQAAEDPRSFSSRQKSDSMPYLLNLFLISIDGKLNADTETKRRRQLLFSFLHDESIRHFPDGFPSEKKRELCCRLNEELWNLAKAAVCRRDFKESVDWYNLSFKFLSSSCSPSSSLGRTWALRTEAKLRRNLAKCYVELRDYAAANAQVEASLRIDPKCLLSLYRNYTVQLHSGREADETLRAFDKILTLGAAATSSRNEGADVSRDNCDGNAADNDRDVDVDDDSINVDSIVSLALDETFKSSRRDLIDGVIERILAIYSSERLILDNQTILIVLKRALLLVFEGKDTYSCSRRMECLKMAFEILKKEIHQKVSVDDEGLRKTIFAEVDWFTQMAWNTIGASFGEGHVSMEPFLLTFKFLVLKELKIRERLDSTLIKEGTEEDHDWRCQWRVNLDMQNQMLGDCVEIGLKRIGDISTGESAEKEVGESLEKLEKICEKRHRVLAELESVAGSSESLSKWKLTASIYHFEVCAKSRRLPQLENLLVEIASLATTMEKTISSFSIFQWLIAICAETNLKEFQKKVAAQLKMISQNV